MRVRVGSKLKTSALLGLPISLRNRVAPPALLGRRVVGDAVPERDREPEERARLELAPHADTHELSQGLELLRGLARNGLVEEGERAREELGPLDPRARLGWSRPERLLARLSQREEEPVPGAPGRSLEGGGCLEELARGNARALPVRERDQGELAEAGLEQAKRSADEGFGPGVRLEQTREPPVHDETIPVCLVSRAPEAVADMHGVQTARPAVRAGRATELS